MKNQLYSFLITLILLALSNQAIASFNEKNDSDIEYFAVSTGNTCGLIGILTIANQTDKVQKISLGSYLIPSNENTPAFVVCNNNSIEKEIAPGSKISHLLYGYSVNIPETFVGENVELAHFSIWLCPKNLNENSIQNWKEDPKIINFDTDKDLAAALLIDAVTNLEDQYYIWKKPLQIPNIYPSDSTKTVRSFIQQAFWHFSSNLQGNSNTFSSFKASVFQQKVVADWLKTNGEEIIPVKDKVITKKQNFVMQVEKLWQIISDLNLYVNPNVRKLLTEPIAETVHTEVEFEPFWQSIELTNILPEKIKKAQISESTFSISSGLISMLPIKIAESPYQHKATFGARFTFIFEPKNQKIGYHVGFAFIPYNSLVANNYMESFNSNINDKFGEMLNSIDIHLQGLRERLKYNTIQIPVGVSYKIINTAKTALLIELSAKPHIKIGAPNYEFYSASDEYVATYTSFGSTPLVLSGENYDSRNEIVAQYLNDISTSELLLSSKVNGPIAIGAGFKLMQNVGISNTKKSNHIGIYMYNNFFIQKPGWAESNKNNEESDFSKYLIKKIFNQENELQNPIGTRYAKDTNTMFVEFGVSYIIKL